MKKYYIFIATVILSANFALAYEEQKEPPSQARCPLVSGSSTEVESGGASNECGGCVAYFDINNRVFTTLSKTNQNQDYNVVQIKNGNMVTVCIIQDGSASYLLEAAECNNGELTFTKNKAWYRISGTSCDLGRFIHDNPSGYNSGIE